MCLLRVCGADVARQNTERGRQRRAPGYPGWEVNPFSPGIPLGLNHPRKRRYCAAAEGVDYLTDRPNTCCSRGAPPRGRVLCRLRVYIRGRQLWIHGRVHMQCSDDVTS